MLSWLPDQTPAVWHQIAMSWNWGDGIEPLDWIVAQPNCDKGTAQTIFWNGEPVEYAGLEGGRKTVPAYRHDVYDLLASIVKRWNDDYYGSWRYRTLPDILGDFRLYAIPPSNIDFDVKKSMTQRLGTVDYDEIDIQLLEGQPLSIIKSCYEERGEKTPEWLLR
jgi:hypothetical protein